MKRCQNMWAGVFFTNTATQRQQSALMAVCDIMWCSKCTFQKQEKFLEKNTVKEEMKNVPWCLVQLGSETHGPCRISSRVAPTPFFSYRGRRQPGTCDLKIKTQRHKLDKMGEVNSLWLGQSGRSLPPPPSAPQVPPMNLGVVLPEQQQLATRRTVSSPTHEYLNTSVVSEGTS